MKFKKISVIFSVTIIAISLCVISSCAVNKEVKKITEIEFPNTVAENAVVIDKYKNVATEMSNFAIDEYINHISKIPRPSGDVDKIRQYLLDWGKDHDLNVTLDDSKNVFYDIPATEGCEDYPNVILQAHMDMVATSLDPNVDLTKDSVPLVNDEEKGEIHSINNKTNIGADDAEGMTTLMALSINKNFKHGNMRMIFTYDEETNQQGAKNIKADDLNADYLINIDCGPTGVLTVSSAGILRANLLKDYKEVDVAKDTQIDISIQNLIGGHSGDDIPKNRLCANVMLRDILQKLTDQNISYNIKDITGGKSATVIAPSADISLFINNKDLVKTKDIINNYFKEEKNKHSEEINATINVKDYVVRGGRGLSESDSKELLEVMKKIPHGVREMDKNFPDTPAISLNFAVVQVEDGHVKIITHSRSEEESGNNSYDAIYKDIERIYGYQYVVENRYSGWPVSEDQDLTDLMFNSYRDTCGFESLKIITHGGLECSRFLEIKPSLKMIALGMDVADEHAVNETWYTKSMPVFFAGLVNCLEKFNTLAK